MGKKIKTVLAGVLTLSMVGLGIVSYNGGIGHVPLPGQAEDYLRPILFNANTIEQGADPIVEETGAARVRRDVRNAAVEIITPMGRGSGTIFEIDGKWIVFTAAHVVNDMPAVQVAGRNGEVVFGTTVLTAAEVDIAVILIPEMNSRTPMDFDPAKRRDINNMCLMFLKKTTKMF